MILFSVILMTLFNVREREGVEREGEREQRERERERERERKRKREGYHGLSVEDPHFRHLDHPLQSSCLQSLKPKP